MTHLEMFPNYGRRYSHYLSLQQPLFICMSNNLKDRNEQCVRCAGTHFEHMLYRLCKHLGAMRSWECEGNRNSVPQKIKRSPKCCCRQASDSPAVRPVALSCCIHCCRSGRFLAWQKRFKSHTNGALIISL